MDEPMTASEYQRWTSVRQRGLLRYGLTRFVPTYGLLFAVLTLVFHLLYDKIESWAWETAGFIFKAIAFGLIMGWMQWRQNEQAYALGAPVPEEEATTECLACNAAIPAGEMRCPACGWTYEGEETSAP
jgi:hypothetical protein